MEGLAAESMSADLEQMKEQIRELMNMVTTMMSAQITENPAQTQQPQQAIPSQSIPVGPGSSQVTGTTTEIPTPAQNPIFLAIPDHQESMLEQQSGTGTSQRRPPARKQERVQKGEVKMITSTGPKRQAIYVQPMAPQPYFVPQNSQPGSQTGQAQPVTGGNAHPRCTEQRTKEDAPSFDAAFARATGSAATKDSESRSQSAESTESKDERDGGNVQKLGTRSNGGASTGYLLVLLAVLLKRMKQPLLTLVDRLNQGSSLSLPPGLLPLPLHLEQDNPFLAMDQLDIKLPDLMPLPKGLGLSRTMPFNPERVLLVMEHPGRGTRRYAGFSADAIQVSAGGEACPYLCLLGGRTRVGIPWTGRYAFVWRFAAGSGEGSGSPTGKVKGKGKAPLAKAHQELTWDEAIHR
ncbi:hypothetical protein Acr_00g0002720 [Actinidia rufa]|uniref:Uncharacterized protein n=1 Tax=Actinidia rufa TaxID=165716 RepID=A0A7J0D759_9ERIC|nr:hypothetical protein Acr_00g0001170 [Actinidia rufa]GFS28597.1 hypothetical protein Acr_00g0002720 [Actinidia rufa]